MEQLRQNVQHNWIWMLTPSWLYKHIQIIHQKKIQGQPISFTDFFGYLVGETILRDVSIEILLILFKLTTVIMTGQKDATNRAELYTSSF